MVLVNVKILRIHQLKTSLTEVNMARPLRIEYEDAYYHITTRENEQKKTFKSNRDREVFRLS